jgi:hypothetical protein
VFHFLNRQKNEKEVVGSSSSREGTDGEKSEFINGRLTMKGLSVLKRLAVGAVATAALAGSVTAAHALQFNAGDLVLAVYGNGTEYVSNLGTISNVVNNGVNVDLTGVLGSLGGANTIKYTVFGYSGTSITFGDSAPASGASGFTTTQKNAIVANTLINTLIGYSGQLASAADVRNLFPATDGLSFETQIVTPDTLGGAIPSAHVAYSNIDSVLNLLSLTGNRGTLSQVGTGLLSSSTGHFVVSAVPVPAAVVLFATGVIGLVGLARRRMSGTQPDAA